MLGGLSFKGALNAALTLSSMCSVAYGLFPDEAGRIDWYRDQIGVPKKIVPHATNIYTITHRNVLASLSANSGEIVWRQAFGDNEPIATLQLRDSQALTLSGSNASSVRVWDSATGTLSWEFAQPASPEYIPGSGAAAFVGGSKDVVAIVGDSFVRLASDSTDPLWTVALNGTATYKRIVVRDDVAFVIGDAARTRKSPNARLHVVEVSLETGAVVKQYDVAEGHTLGGKSLVVIESRDYGAYVVWRDEANIIWFIHRLGLPKPLWEIFHPKSVQVELMPEDMLTSAIAEIDPHPELNDDTPRFAFTYTKDDKTKTLVVEMFHDDKKLDMRKVVGFRSEGGVVASFGAADKSLGAADSLRSTLSARAVDGSLSWRIYKDKKDAEHSGSISYDPSLYGPLSKASLFYTSSREPRILVQTVGGLLVALAPGSTEPVWFRDESLAHATDMQFMDLPPPASSAEYAAKATDPSVVSSPVTRYILRWVETTKSVSAWVFSGFGLFGSASDSNSSSRSGPAAHSMSELIAPASPLTAGDHFGFRKLSIFATSSGVIAALSTQDGSRSWTRWLAANGTAIRVENVFVTRRTQPLSSAVALVTAVGRDIRGRTVIADLDALTGLPVGGEEAVQGFVRGHAKVFELPVADPLTGQKLIGIVTNDAEPQFKIWPSTPTAAEAFFAVADSVFFDLGGKQGSTQLRGYSIERPADLDISSWNKDSSAPTKRQWAFDLPEGETLIKQTDYSGAQSTALLGRVLGDRSVLYKYINPHLVTVSTQLSQGGIGVYFVDRVSGRLLYSTVHASARVTASQPFLAVQTENRVIYQFWQDGFANTHADNASRGYITVVAELFESDMPDTRETSKSFSGFDLLLPSVVTTAFTAPEPASALGVTRTGSHITTRDVLFGLASSKLLGLPDQLFDPRRPTHPPTKDEQAEGLLPYAAPLPLDPKRVLSHYNPVAGIKHIASAPTHLESTSLVASFGLDLFFTRTSPSGTFDQLSPSFSKINLVGTTLALVVGCLLGGPMVRRKMTNQAWA
ncbi:hypothetical protein EV175_003062 [Coemansia sp. RSA 1933]|nr:hypothetical protein EV175_003062 [Coemansia sp. RSA 1933]